MIELTIPGRRVYRVDHLVMDVNGTIALDGKLVDGVRKSIYSLRDRLEIHLITADTHNRQHLIDEALGLTAVRLKPGEPEPGQKALFIRQLGSDTVVAVGQGANDAEMLKEAAIGIAVMSPEGLAVPTLLAADLVVPDILLALQMFEKPLRMVATLRS